MKVWKSAIGVLTLSSMMAGCTTAGTNVAATYVSPVQYARYDCEQLREELVRINSRVAQMTGRLDQAAQSDTMMMTVGLLLFWPAMFAVGGSKQQEAELSRLKGEYDALLISSTEKKCSAGASAPTADAAQ